MLFLLLTMKDNKDFGSKWKPLLKTMLDNKELLSLLLNGESEKENHAEKEEQPQKTEEEPEEEKNSPPPEKGATNETLMNFLNRYFK